MGLEYLDCDHANHAHIPSVILVPKTILLLVFILLLFNFSFYSVLVLKIILLLVFILF